MRVLTVGALYPPHYSGGYELVWRAFVRHMRSHGHDVRLLCTDIRMEHVPPDAEEDPGVARVLSSHVHTRQPPLGRRALIARELHNARAFDWAVEELRPDLVMWWHMLGVSLGLMARARAAGLRTMSVVHDEWPLYGPAHDAWLAVWAKRPQRARAAGALALGVATEADPLAVDAISFNSEWLARRVLGDARGATDGVTVIPPGIPDGLFGPAPPGPWRGRLAYVGRIDERKGLGVAVDALALVPEATLTITGGGDDAYLAELRARAGDRVRFESAAARADLQRVYEACDAVVFPVTWHEPWGLVPLEAMATGRPVIATGTGGSGEYLRHEHNALLVEPGDATALAAAVARLRDEPALRERLVENGFATAAEHIESGSLAAMEREAERVAGG